MKRTRSVITSKPGPILSQVPLYHNWVNTILTFSEQSIKREARLASCSTVAPTDSLAGLLVALVPRVHRWDWWAAAGAPPITCRRADRVWEVCQVREWHTSALANQGWGMAQPVLHRKELCKNTHWGRGNGSDHNTSILSPLFSPSAKQVDHCFCPRGNDRALCPASQSKCKTSQKDVLPHKFWQVQDTFGGHILMSFSHRFCLRRCQQTLLSVKQPV